VSIARERAVGALVVVNIVLQMLDGMLTYAGVVHAGLPEGNPLVAYAMLALGPAPALGVLKLQACACLLVVWALRHRSRLAEPALVVSAVAYAVMSLGPWSAVLAPRYLTGS
jgi:hypothetical protein